MDCQAFFMKVQQGKYQEYKDAHDQLWPEMDRQLLENKIDIAIYYDEPFLFVYLRAPSAQTWIKHGSSEVTHRWNQYMANLLECNVDGTIKMYPLEEVFTRGIFQK